MPREAIFWDKVERIADGCWLWTGALHPTGYGMCHRTINGRSIRYAHRLAYELFVGPVPEGLYLDHLCRQRRCVRPSHLEPVSFAENVRRGVGPTARNRRKTHCKHGHEFTQANTIRIGPDGRWRECRQCRTDRYVRSTR